MTDKKIILYRAENPFWLTGAAIKDNGDLVIKSGDADNEWSMIVPAGSKSALLDALLMHVVVGEVAGEEADARLLRALSAMFAGDRTPFDDIRTFLERHAIPARDLNWLWGGDQD